MLQHWQYWTKVLDDTTVNNIIELGETFPIHNAGIGTDDTQNYGYRSSQVHWIRITDSRSKFLTELVWYYAQEANKTAFGFDISYVPDIQYTKYDAASNGKYDWHHDVFWTLPSMQHRKLSIVIQLSDSNDYTGGDFEFYPEYPQPPAQDIRQKGTIIVFPSFLHHRVTQVTSGIRRSAVCWVEGPKFR